MHTKWRELVTQLLKVVQVSIRRAAVVLRNDALIASFLRHETAAGRFLSQGG